MSQNNHDSISIHINCENTFIFGSGTGNIEEFQRMVNAVASDPNCEKRVGKKFPGTGRSVNTQPTPYEGMRTTDGTGGFFKVPQLFNKGNGSCTIGGILPVTSNGVQDTTTTLFPGNVA